MDTKEGLVTGTIRESVDAIDDELLALINLSEIVPSHELTMAITRLQECRMWLKEVGHGGRFDTPEQEWESTK